MKKTELKKEIENLGLVVETDHEEQLVRIKMLGGKVIATVSEITEYNFGIEDTGELLDPEKKSRVAQLVMTYSATKIADRAGEKEYYIVFDDLDDSGAFLNMVNETGDGEDSYYIFSSKDTELPMYRTHFTETDIDSLPNNLKLALETGVLSKTEIV